MVNLGADIAANLPFLRAQAESRMTEVFQFFTVESVFDEDTLNDVATETVLLTTQGRLKVSTAQGRDVESGAQFPVVQRLEVHIPSTPQSPTAPSPWLLPGDDVLPAVSIGVGVRVRCVDSSADLSLVGREFRVSERPAAGQTTAHRFVVEEIS